MRGLILAALLLLSAQTAAQPTLQVVVDAEHHAQAWWMYATLEPGGRMLRGIPIGEFDPDWCAADELTVNAFPEAVRNDGPWPLARLAGEGRSPFSTEGRSGAGEALEVFIGAYRTCSGERRNFLAVLAPERTGRHIVQVESISAGKAVFQYLVADADGTGFRIYSCLA
ncbi:MAG: hypothetical protein J7507_05240, partial [Pseudoxanthomonas sp.]|nr:hypothetical protein [Pseudoxanthomonas sp.]